MKKQIIFIFTIISPLAQGIWFCPGKKIGDVMTKAFSPFATEEEAREYCAESACEIENQANPKKHDIP